MTAHETLIGNAALLPLGVLDSSERRALEAHLADGCARCERAMLEARQVCDRMALAVTPAPVTPASKVRLMRRVRTKPGRAPARGRGREFLLLAATAASLAAAAFLGLDSLEGRRRADAEKSARIRAEQSLAGLRDSFPVVAAPHTRTVLLAGEGGTSSAVARAFLDPSRGRLLLYADGLPEPPAGRTYQLWVIVGSSPVSAGVFQTDRAGRAFHEQRAFEGLGESPTLAVTIEPEGGLPAPSGPMVLSGS